MSKKQVFSLSIVLVVGLVGIGQAKLPDPVGWWKLDDGAGTTAIDSSGNGYDGTVGGDAAWVDGKYGGGLEFSGSGWVDLPVEIWNDVLAVDSTLSFCFFHYIEGPYARNTSFGVSGGGSRHFQTHLPWLSGLIYFDIASTGRDTASYQDEWLGQWNHFCYMYAPLGIPRSSIAMESLSLTPQAQPVPYPPPSPIGPSARAGATDKVTLECLMMSVSITRF